MSKPSNVIDLDCNTIVANTDFTPFESKTIMITGASGLIGSYLLNCLKIISKDIAGISIVAVFRSELPAYLSENDFTNLSVYKGDITDATFSNSLPEADYIIHAAGYGQPIKFMDESVKTLKLNTWSTFFLFEKLKANGNFLFISSSEVYSGLKSSVYKESEIGTTNTTHPRACYIEGKRGGEAICNAYRQQGIKASAVRLGHTYGPGTKKGDQRVILSFIEKALNGEINLLDNGEAIRTYCYIADAIEIIWQVLLSCNAPIYNLGGRSRVSIRQVAETIASIMNVPTVMPQNIENAVAGAPEDVQLDMQLIESEFGKNEYVDFETGIKRTINWYLDSQQ